MFRFFPEYWDQRKVSELRVAIYMALVGSLFWVYPSALDAPVYRSWLDFMAPEAWGLLMMLTALGHFAGVWLNGRAIIVSSIVRLAACVSHLSIALTFALFFAYGGAPWGTITYLAVVAWPLVGACGYAIEQLVRAYGKTAV